MLKRPLPVGTWGRLSSRWTMQRAELATEPTDACLHGTTTSSPAERQPADVDRDGQVIGLAFEERRLSGDISRVPEQNGQEPAKSGRCRANISKKGP